MKGIAHFAAGVAAASCFPEAVRAGADGNPAYFLIGGILGLLPDTLDFKFYRFFYRHDIEIVPDPLRPDPAMIASAVALAINRAREEGRPVRVKLSSIRLGADRWQSYSVRFDTAGRRIAVAYGPVVDTGGLPLPGCDAPPPDRRHQAEAPIVCPLKLDYEATTTVDILDGPLFSMDPTGDGRVVPRFIPWHRLWTHSFPTALLLALGCAALWGPLAGVVAMAGYSLHVLLDQLGGMGGNLFWPFAGQRIPGLKLMRSGDTVPNFGTVWISCAVVFWNLCRISPEGIPHMSPLKFGFYGAVLPLLLAAGTRRVIRRHGRTAGTES